MSISEADKRWKLGFAGAHCGVGKNSLTNHLREQQQHDVPEKYPQEETLTCRHTRNQCKELHDQTGSVTLNPQTKLPHVPPFLSFPALESRKAPREE